MAQSRNSFLPLQPSEIPKELAENLIEEEVELIDNDGSSRGERHFIIYNPPVTDPALGLRKSSLLESVRLANDLFTHNIQSVVFAQNTPKRGNYPHLSSRAIGTEVNTSKIEYQFSILTLFYSSRLSLWLPSSSTPRDRTRLARRHSQNCRGHECP